MRLEPLTLVLDGAVPIPAGALVAYLAARPREARAFVADLADAIIQEQDALEDTDQDDDIADQPHDAEDDACDCEDRGGEPSLGAPEVEFTYRGLPVYRGHIDQTRWWDGGVQHGEDEPTLGSSPGWPWTGQRGWSSGYHRNPEMEEAEGHSDDDKGIDDEPHDGDDVVDCCDSERGEPLLGSLDRRTDQRGWAGDGMYAAMPEAEADRSDYEPSLGAPLRHHDQRTWGQGDTHDREPNGDEADECNRDLPRTEEEVATWPGVSLV